MTELKRFVFEVDGELRVDEEEHTIEKARKACLEYAENNSNPVETEVVIYELVPIQRGSLKVTADWENVK